MSRWVKKTDVRKSLKQRNQKPPRKSEKKKVILVHLWNYIKTEVWGDFKGWNALPAAVGLWLNKKGVWLLFLVPSDTGAAAKQLKSCNEHPLPALLYPKNASGDVLTSPMSWGLADSLPCAERILVASLSLCLPSLSWVKMFVSVMCKSQTGDGEITAFKHSVLQPDMCLCNVL